MHPEHRRFVFSLAPSQRRGSTWLQRTVAFVVAATVAVSALFFLTLALILGVILALAIAIRWFTLGQRRRVTSGAATALEGEYRVVREVEKPIVR
jgi:hypothetical protein